MSFLRLQYTRSDGEVDTYHLKSGRRYNVGRGSSCEVRILDMRLSRKHCAFECINDDWLVCDLGSTNGCKIKEERIETSVAVSSQTTVTLGSVEIFVASISEHLDEPSGEHQTLESDDQLAPDELDLDDNNKAITQAGPASDEIDEDEGDPKASSVEYAPTISKPDSSESTAGEETKTVFISALGKRVGPITRTQARELKKRELQGALTEADLEDILEAP